MLAATHPSTGVGLANISERLAQAYGPDHRFEIHSPPDGGFTVILELPLEYDPAASLAAPHSPAFSPPLLQPAISPAAAQALGTSA